MQETRDACRHALSLNPIDVPEDVAVQQRAYLFMHLGKLEYKSGNKKEGIRLTKSAIDLYPHGDMYRSLMTMYTSTWQLRQAHKTAVAYTEMKARNK